MKTRKFLSVLLALTLMAQLFSTSLVSAVELPEGQLLSENGTEGEIEAFALASGSPDDYNGSDMWLRYVPVSDPARLMAYKTTIKRVFIPTGAAADLFRFSDTEVFTETYGVEGLQQPEGSVEKIPKTTLEAAKNELDLAFGGMLGGIPTTTMTDVAVSALVDGSLVVGTPETSTIVAGLNLDAALEAVGDEGYIIKSMKVDGKNVTVVAGNTEIGALYGTYALLRLMQTQEPITNLDISDYPKINHRRINSWEKERFYAGNNVGTNYDKGGLNGESGFLFNWDLSIPGSGTTGNNAHSNASQGALLMPNILDRYVVAARALASVGINEFNLNNVNSNSAYISEYIIRQEAALADLLRPYGIRLCLSTNYGAPMLDLPNQNGTAVTTSNGGNPNRTVYADATTKIGTVGGNPKSQADIALVHSDAYAQWWYDKTVQIVERIPDFAGYTVKANSEGQAGPQDYGDTHAFGSTNMAKLLDTDALEGKGITVFWRSFVYDPKVDNDRLNRAYMEFGPADDPEDDRDIPFLDNVFVQTKNGPLDFQAREIFHPMFGRMPNTNQAIEFQITMEYLGHSSYMTFLGPLYEEVLKSDTYANGPGTLVGNILDGSAQGQTDTAMVGVNNMGNHEAVTGHNFLQANTYTFGRQAWNWTLNSEDIANEWTRMTWSNEEDVVNTIVEMMMGSREAVVATQNPLGLMHQQAQNGTAGSQSDHYAPGQWDFSASQDDWTPAYYNKAMKDGIGFRRTVEGRIADLLPVAEPGSIDEKYYPFANQFFSPLTEQFSNPATTPEEFLLAFHHLPWDYEMKNGNTLWEELIYKPQMGVQYATYLRETWAGLEGTIDQYRWEQTMQKLIGQEYDMAVWRDRAAEYWCIVNGLDMPTDTAPLSIKISVAGKTHGGFDLNYGTTSKVAGDPWENVPSVINGINAPLSGVGTRPYTIYVPAGTTVPTIDRVIPHGKDVKYEIVKQARNMNDTAVVKVTAVADLGAGVMGHLVQNYTFAFQYDTTLTGITVGGMSIKPFSPNKTSYQVYTDAKNPAVTVTKSDPAAADDVVVNDGVATITVTNGSVPANVYTVRIMPGGKEFAEEFTSDTLDSKWSWVREDGATWSLSDTSGAMTITADAGDLRNTSNTAKNILLTDAPEGDWVIESKLNFSRAPEVINEQAGIIAYLDDNTYVMFNWKKNSNSTDVQTGTHGLDLVFQQGGDKSTTLLSNRKDVSELAAGLDQDQIWLRIEKRGDVYIGYFSNNGINWKPTRLASSTAASASTASLVNSANLPKVGMVAMNLSANVSGLAPMKVSYDYFKITPIGETLTAPPPTPSGPSSSGSTPKPNPVTTTKQETNKDGTIAVEILVDGKPITKPLDKPALVTVPLGDLGSNSVAYIVDKDGKETPIIFSKTTGSNMQLLLNNSSTIVIHKVEADFIDMESHWSRNEVQFVFGRDLFIGTSDTKFSPDATVTLATLPQVLYRMAGEPALTAADVYPGIEVGKWYSNAMNWLGGNLMDKELAEDITKLSPDGEVSTEVLMTLLYGYAVKTDLVAADATYNVPGSKFGDNVVLSYAEKAMNWAVGTGLLVGNEHGIVIPGATVTRAMLATIVARFVGQQVV